MQPERTFLLDNTSIDVLVLGARHFGEGMPPFFALPRPGQSDAAKERNITIIITKRDAPNV